MPACYPTRRSLSVTAPSGHVGAKMHLNTLLPWSRLREIPRTHIRIDRGKARPPPELHAIRYLSSPCGKRPRKKSYELSKIGTSKKTVGFDDMFSEGNRIAGESGREYCRLRELTPLL